MNPIQKPLDKNEREIPKETSKSVDNKTIYVYIYIKQEKKIKN